MDGGIKWLLLGIEITILGGVFVVASGGTASIGVWVAVGGLVVALMGLGTPARSQHPEDQRVP
jgi:hypothetical protein